MNTSRPLTGSLSPAVRSIMAFYAPIHAADHLVQAWDALDQAGREPEKADACRAFARNRLECAKSEPVARAVKPSKRKAYAAECAELAAELS